MRIRSVEIVNQIAAAVAAGGSLRKVAAQFGVSTHDVAVIKAGRHRLQLSPEERAAREAADVQQRRANFATANQRRRKVDLSAIVAAIVAGGSLRKVAAQFGTSDTTVGLIRQGRHPLQLQRPDRRRGRRKVDLSAVAVEGESGRRKVDLSAVAVEGESGRGFTPTRQQIRAARKVIRSSWSPEERQRRWEWAHSVTIADIELQKRLVG